MPDEDALFQRRDPSGRIPYLACKMGEGFAFKWRQPVVIGLHDFQQLGHAGSANGGDIDLPLFSGPLVNQVCSPFVCHHSAA